MEIITAREDVYVSHSMVLETLRVAGVYLHPFVPGVASPVLDALDAPGEERAWAWAGARTCVGSSGARLFWAGV
ncbi:hypothetical protein Hypma_013110 [Hypsizygus marmoreus]|uniref:Uncharacterized protein n=1 Tax=Hypsizygus marmoreus TaxID=39966 RepID=A0A369JD47_HYPMA|nr:hypothetical protein Hypma_013110 [Hypsizygus marmoreus]